MITSAKGRPIWLDSRSGLLLKAHSRTARYLGGLEEQPKLC